MKSAFFLKAGDLKTSHYLMKEFGSKRAHFKQMIRVHSCPFVVSRLHRYG